jgi:hypothetical protein
VGSQKVKFSLPISFSARWNCSTAFSYLPRRERTKPGEREEKNLLLARGNEREKEMRRKKECRLFVFVVNDTQFVENERIGIAGGLSLRREQAPRESGSGGRERE